MGYLGMSGSNQKKKMQLENMMRGVAVTDELGHGHPQNLMTLDGSALPVGHEQSNNENTNSEVITGIKLMLFEMLNQFPALRIMNPSTKLRINSIENVERLEIIRSVTSECISGGFCNENWSFGDSVSINFEAQRARDSYLLRMGTRSINDALEITVDNSKTRSQANEGVRQFCIETPSSAWYVPSLAMAKILIVSSLGKETYLDFPQLRMYAASWLMEQDYSRNSVPFEVAESLSKVVAGNLESVEQVRQYARPICELLDKGHDSSVVLDAWLAPYKLKVARHGISTTFEFLAEDEKEHITRVLNQILRGFSEANWSVVTFGATALGFHRELDFVPYDDDLDILIVPSPTHQVSVRSFSEVRRQAIDHLRGLSIPGLRMKSIYPPSPIDVFRVFINSIPLDIVIGLEVEGQVRMKRKRISSIDRNKLFPQRWISVHGHKVPMPREPDAFFKAIYGSEWPIRLRSGLNQKEWASIQIHAASNDTLDLKWAGNNGHPEVC